MFAFEVVFFSFLMTAARAALLTNLFSVIRLLSSICSSCAARPGGASLNNSLVESFSFSSVCRKVSSFCVRKFSNSVLIWCFDCVVTYAL